MKRKTAKPLLRTHLILSLSFIVLLISCSQSPKKIVLSGDEWLVSNSSEIKDVSLYKGLRFTDNTITTLKLNNSYKVKWIDGETCNIEIDGKDVIVRMRMLSKDKLQAAFLYDSEKLPKSEIEWTNLQNDNRVLYFIKKRITGKSYEVYKVGDKSIPAAKVPPAGLYVFKDLKGDVVGAINVIINDDIVKFQTGEDINGLMDDKADVSFVGNLAPSISSISFSGKFGSCDYIGNGVIESSGSYFNGNSGESVKFIKETSTNNGAENTDDLLINVAKTANDYKFIYKNDQNTGRIVKIELTGFFPHSYGAGVTTLDVPEGKMWTPLYYEQIRGKHDVSVMDIFYKTRSGYSYNDYFEFKTSKKDFVSCKLSKQNNKAFVRKDHVAVSMTSYSSTKSIFILYCLEESL